MEKEEEKGEINNKTTQTDIPKEEIDSVHITLLVGRKRGAKAGRYA